jgi:hypothetical protein
MTKHDAEMNEQVRELTLDEIDVVSGGSIWTAVRTGIYQACIKETGPMTVCTL